MMTGPFPAPGERVPYTLLTRDQQHALHAWLRGHNIDPGRVPLYADFDYDPTTGEWRIPVYWHDPDGWMRLNPDGETVRKHVVRRRELRPLPWPTHGPPVVTFNGVDISGCISGIEIGGSRCPACGLKAWDADNLIPGEYVCTCDEPDDDAGHGDDWPPVVTVDTGGLL